MQNPQNNPIHPKRFHDTVGCIWSFHQPEMFMECPEVVSKSQIAPKLVCLWNGSSPPEADKARDLSASL